ncbi:gamma-glutamyltransferase [Mycolicibacterium smegmatis]|uniref:gamma-glutamyltransferase family protein n=1 Tax=Mycolicibacterium smegmatis TaxID=1772 RepID=UPI001E6504E7|nr:gamma-glutamyltransferase [Mycolicibacterium smegmatis]UGU30932.1 gamma-glutamyltransferase [Mycolicibacterium smegmatis]ULN71840.1 gamma-glutamyltransferase [Mycolicibacterium smegmatis]
MSTFTGALASPHALATEAGMAAFAEGGNAIDAAISAAAVLTVVYPHNVALGGDLIALVRTPDGIIRCVNASGWSGGQATAERMRTRHGRSLPARHADSVTVPGGVRGWEALRSLGCRISWAQTLAPAQRVAEAGVAVAKSLAHHIADPENADLAESEDFCRVFRPGGRMLATGEALVQPALASTFAALRQQGPDAFYTGALADSMLAHLGKHGSCLTAADFAEFTPEFTEPLSARFGDLTVLTSPPNTHGFAMLRALRAIEERDVADPLGAGIGTLMRIFHHGNVLRERRLGDPRLSDIDTHALVNGALGEVAELGKHPGPVLVPHGDTVGVAAADSDGFAVSLIQSVYHAFGSGLIDPETGVLFHNRGTSFSLDPDSPNVIAPRKRPAHTLMPALTTRDGAVRHVLSTMGGQGQPQILTQVLLHAVAGESAQSAVSAPRAIAGGQVDGATADSVVVEADLEAQARESLHASGLNMVEVPVHTEAMGQANVVFVDAGAMQAASDPRSDGAGMVAHYPRGPLAGG